MGTVDISIYHKDGLSLSPPLIRFAAFWLFSDSGLSVHLYMSCPFPSVMMRTSDGGYFRGDLLSVLPRISVTRLEGEGGCSSYDSAFWVYIR